MRLNEFKFENDIESKIDEFGILSDKIDKVKMELSELSNRELSDHNEGIPGGGEKSGILPQKGSLPDFYILPFSIHKRDD